MRYLGRLILALGAGAAIGLIVSLIQRLMTPRLTNAPGSEQQPVHTSGHEATPAGQEAAVATLGLQASKHSDPEGVCGGDGRQFAAFMSHAKADASMEARCTAALTLALIKP